ncbi:Acetyltransferase (isoleucine patch superfamily) [Chryseobacterium oranimense]|uniref:Acetyltransferase (Isoleucine patch superfamily) n=1 Tax=Chryseobacterium oranimense TaxID=421058 RepID=A0A1M5LWY4_9FLAO|nr:DapH/DapD/GlmU-related protein [Chryseobacterium oranimense]SHG69547.1 Acetyltransferase (isoleucine patch superfamily) [Chryseobacterium oranimense]
MMKKIFWGLRMIIYAPFLGKVRFPSYIGKPTFIYGLKRIFIGKKVRIYPNVRLEAHGENSKLIISDNVAIGQNVHITTGSTLVIGKSTTILANVFITDIDHNYEKIGVPILEQENIIKKTEIGENCFIGIGAAIQAGTILGKQCIVGANSVVRGKFDDYCVIVGVPAKPIKKYNFETQKWEKISN